MRILTPWAHKKNGEPLHPIREVEDWARRLFGLPIEEAVYTPAWEPRVDIEETEKEVLVKADLPGVEPKDVDVSVLDGSLILRGEKKDEKEEKGTKFHRVERFYGTFYRELPLPAGVDPDKVSAICAKGVVTVVIPKKPAAESKKIASSPSKRCKAARRRRTRPSGASGVNRDKNRLTILKLPIRRVWRRRPARPSGRTAT
jgi:HSP20 family protein